MPAIGDMEFGYDKAGVEAYLEDIKSGVLQTAKDKINDITGITTACDNTWQGKSKTAFLANMKKDAAHVSEQFDALYAALVSEVNSVAAAMANKDESLIVES